MTTTASKFSVATTANTSTGVVATTVDIVALSSTDANTLAVSSSSTTSDIATLISAVGQALDNVNAASEPLGASQKNVDLQSSFISSLNDAITTGVGSLVDADMNQASTRLSALQTQQQRAGPVGRQPEQPAHPQAVPVKFETGVGLGRAGAK